MLFELVHSINNKYNSLVFAEVENEKQLYLRLISGKLHSFKESLILFPKDNDILLKKVVYQRIIEFFMSQR